MKSASRLTHLSSHRYEHALDILDLIIKKDETNAASRKRKVTIYKSQGMIIEAIKELTDYLRM
jgi:hypothetical protein